MADRTITQRLCDAEHPEPVTEALRITLQVQGDEPRELDLCPSHVLELVTDLQDTMKRLGGPVAKPGRGQRPYVPRKNQPKPPTAAGWPCPECDNVQRSFQGLNWHKRNAHGWVGGKPRS